MHKKRKTIVIVILLVIIVMGLFICSGFRKRTDVVLIKHEILEDNKKIKLSVGVTSSVGYVRKIKVKEKYNSIYVTFYSTFGINSNFGAKHEYTLELNSNVENVYFYTKDGYKLVLTNNKNTWEKIDDNEYKKTYKIVDKTIGLDNFLCPNGLEEIYLDDKYIYYLPCVKSEYIKVIFTDNKELSIIEALKYNKVSIEDLDEFNIEYYKKSIS